MIVLVCPISATLGDMKSDTDSYHFHPKTAQNRITGLSLKALTHNALRQKEDFILDPCRGLFLYWS